MAKTSNQRNNWNSPIQTTIMQRFEENYTLDDYLAAIRRRARVFFLVSLPIVAIASGLALMLPNEYRSEARIAVDLEGTNVQTLEPIQVAAYADQYIAELRDRVLSGDNLLPFVEDASNFPESEDELPLSDRMRILNLGFYFDLETQPVTIDSGRQVDVISGFSTGFEGPDPEFAVRAARFFAAEFLNEDRVSRTAEASSTAAFLNKQIAETESEIVALEQDVADFKVKNACCLPELKELNMSVIQRTERDIESLQPRIRTLEQDRIFLQAQLEEIRKQSASTNRLAILEQEYVRLVANYGPDHPDVRRVRREIQAIMAIGPMASGNNELALLRIELAEAERRYSSIHPDVISLKSRIEALAADTPSVEQSEQNRLIENPRYLQLRSEINALGTELVELRRRNPELRNKIADYEQRLIRTPQIESEYQALNRKLETARENFDNLQRRLVIARQTEALESTEIGARLNEIQPAYLPGAPNGPRRLAIFIIGAFFAGSLGIGSIILAEILDSTVRCSKDITKTLDVIPLATIPVVQNSESRAISKRNFIILTSLSLAVAVGITLVVVSNSV